MKIGAIFILVCSLAYAADEKTYPVPTSITSVMDKELPNGKGHIHKEIFYRGSTTTRIMEFHQKTVAGQTKTGRIFFLGDVTVYETEDHGDKRFRSLILFNDQTKQVEGFIEKPDGRAVPFDAKTVAATTEQIDAAVSFWSETHGKEFVEVAKALQEKLRDSEKTKGQDER